MVRTELLTECCKLYIHLINQTNIHIIGILTKSIII